jgi:hypothetical protein
MEGKPVYGDERFEPLFRDLELVGSAAKGTRARGQGARSPAAGADFTRVKIQGKNKIVVGDPAGLVKKLRKIVGFHKELPYLPV